MATELTQAAALLAQQRGMGSHLGSVPVRGESGDLAVTGPLKGESAHLFEGGAIITLGRDDQLAFLRGVTELTRERGDDGDDQTLYLSGPDGSFTLYAKGADELHASEQVASSITA
ncbi:hypothetical protein [Aestuariimicrobium ganziense]|uniref:hypothetical protein n=1 Tax=Aestuariimicrobium ganziense TaxID=2773677 RepID=UPI001944809C|nr:hypothetical protein [Aestuariimicrobium ganziense]